MTIATSDEITERYQRVQDEIGKNVTLVVATKYVSVEEMAVLADAGVDVVGENRAQDLERKHEAYGDAFRWHFIGHLQSNKVKVVNRLCELVHSLSSESAGGRLSVPALVEVNLSGEETKSGVAPDEVARYLERFPSIRGLMTMPPLDSRPGDLPAVLPPSARARGREWPQPAQHGNIPGLPRRGGGGATLVRIGEALFRQG